MRNTAKFLSAGALALLLAVGAAAQQPPQAPQTPAQASPQQPTFRVSVDLVTTDVIVRDNRDQFVADLKAGEFEVFEDGVQQEIVSLVLTHGGRVISDHLEAHASATGLLVPPPRPPIDASGRIFLIFLDDQHVDPALTPRLRALLKQIRHELVHPGDLVGMVSSGTSSIAVELTYDIKRIDEAIGKAMGGGLKPTEIIDRKYFHSVYFR